MWLKVLLLAVVAIDAYSRHDFPSDFFFGASTSAFQVEGAADENGRTPSIFDTYAHSKGDVYGGRASDQYHKYKEDVELMAEMGLNAYRFSISWSRLIPNGRGPVNPKGLKYYNNLINELINHGIQPHITLHHSDLPQALEDEYEGWLSRRYPSTPWELQRVLESLKQDYGNLPIYIHENGQQTSRNSSLDDWSRVDYLQGHIKAVLDTVRNGTNVKGYFVWSFLDLYELVSGYETIFGLYYLDLDDPNLKRQHKLSAKWYSSFLHGKTMDQDLTIEELKKNATTLSLH